MNVSLTPELDKFVASKVESGRYNSASEVVREALRLLEEYDRARGAQLAAFNQELGARLASLDRGEHVEPEMARGRLELKSRERRRLSHEFRPLHFVAQAVTRPFHLPVRQSPVEFAIDRQTGPLIGVFRRPRLVLDIPPGQG